MAESKMWWLIVGADKVTTHTTRDGAIRSFRRARNARAWFFEMEESANTVRVHGVDVTSAFAPPDHN